MKNPKCPHCEFIVRNAPEDAYYLCHTRYHPKEGEKESGRILLYPTHEPCYLLVRRMKFVLKQGGFGPAASKIIKDRMIGKDEIDELMEAK